MKIYTNDCQFGICPRARVFVNMFADCFNEYMREFRYMAECADLNFSMVFANDSANMDWSGYSDSLPVFV